MSTPPSKCSKNTLIWLSWKLHVLETEQQVRETPSHILRYSDAGLSPPHSTSRAPHILCSCRNAKRMNLQRASLNLPPACPQLFFLPSLPQKCQLQAQEGDDHVWIDGKEQSEEGTGLEDLFYSSHGGKGVPLNFGEAFFGQTDRPHIRDLEECWDTGFCDWNAGFGYYRHTPGGVLWTWSDSINLTWSKGAAYGYGPDNMIPSVFETVAIYYAGRTSTSGPGGAGEDGGSGCSMQTVGGPLP